MNWKRFWLSVLGVYAVYQVLYFLTHEVWLAETYAARSELWRDPLELVSTAWIPHLTGALWTLAFCLLYARFGRKAGLGGGAVFGALAGLLGFVPSAWEVYARMPIPRQLALEWALCGLVTATVCGVVVAALYRPRD
jgi:hypothetical protein